MQLFIDLLQCVAILAIVFGCKWKKF